MNAATQDQSVSLKVSTREKETAKALRRAGLIPLVLYGNGISSQSLTTSKKEITTLLRHHGTTTLIDLSIGESKPLQVLLREPQYHPVTHEVVHVDLFKVNLKEKITAEVNLNFEGVAPAVDALGGTLIESKASVEVEALPQDLPHELTVDITPLSTFDDVLRVSDIKLPAGVTMLSEPDEVIASVAEPRTDEELAALDEAVEENIEDIEVATGEETEEESEDTKESTEE